MGRKKLKTPESKVVKQRIVRNARVVRVEYSASATNYACELDEDCRQKVEYVCSYDLLESGICNRYVFFACEPHADKFRKVYVLCNS